MDGRLRRQRKPRRHRARTGIAGLPGRGGEGGCRARWRRRARRKTAQGEMSVDRGIGECRRGWRHDVGAGIEKHRRRQRDHEIEDRCPLRHARRSLLGVRITEIRLLAGRDHGFATRTTCRHGRLSLKKRPRKPFAVIRLEHFEPAAAGGGKMSVSTHALELKAAQVDTAAEQSIRGMSNSREGRAAIPSQRRPLLGKRLLSRALIRRRSARSRPRIAGGRLPML